MKIRIPIFVLIILIIGCQNKQIDNKKTEIKISDKHIDFSVTDSLNKYSVTDSLFKYKTHRFYAGRANHIDFGLVELSDTSFILYQKNKTEWIITDTFYYPLFYVFKPQDLNDDSYEDVIITYECAASGANGQNICLLYDTKTERLYHNKHFDLPNIRYDKNLNLVLSPWWGGVVHCQYKESYKIIADSLTFNLGVMFCPKENNENEPAGVQYYKIHKGKRIIIKTLKGKPEKMWEIFENAIWNSKDEY